MALNKWICTKDLKRKNKWGKEKNELKKIWKQDVLRKSQKEKKHSKQCDFDNINHLSTWPLKKKKQQHYIHCCTSEHLSPCPFGLSVTDRVKASGEHSSRSLSCLLIPRPCPRTWYLEDLFWFKSRVSHAAPFPLQGGNGKGAGWTDARPLPRTACVAALL